MTKAFQIATLLVFAGAASAAAQHPTHAPVTTHVKNTASANKPTAETRGAESAEHVKSFRGIAAKLNATPEAMQMAYEQAKSANPKLTRGQFIAANMLGLNLSDKGITTVTAPACGHTMAPVASGKSTAGLSPMSITPNRSLPGPAASYAALSGSSPDVAVMLASLPWLNTRVRPRIILPRHSALSITILPSALLGTAAS